MFHQANVSLLPRLLDPRSKRLPALETGSSGLCGLGILLLLLLECNVVLVKVSLLGLLRLERLGLATSLIHHVSFCLLYTSDAADEEDSVDLGGRRIIKKKKYQKEIKKYEKTNAKKKKIQTNTTKKDK
eukprot:TRINITY_DN2531_c0_g1_i2.p2 TRINITY_DN2531_c0_g1~~TRINITY_DN2531_c0_g1_i2.p2  ORF type:complete len:129 (-),score=20.25 TRINITY_DN2531_c0_g1_i2:42-428(-)